MARDKSNQKEKEKKTREIFFAKNSYSIYTPYLQTENLPKPLILNLFSRKNNSVLSAFSIKGYTQGDIPRIMASMRGPRLDYRLLKC